MGIPTLLHLSRIPLHAREHSCSSAFTVTGIAWDFHPTFPQGNPMGHLAPCPTQPSAPVLCCRNSNTVSHGYPDEDSLVWETVSLASERPASSS